MWGWRDGGSAGCGCTGRICRFTAGGADQRAVDAARSANGRRAACACACACTNADPRTGTSTSANAYAYAESACTEANASSGER